MGTAIMSAKMVRLVVMVFALLIIGLSLCSCGFLLYDFIEGRGTEKSNRYSLQVNYQYSGGVAVSSSTPLFLVIFGYYFSGFEPDIIYMSDPFVSDVGVHTFSDLDELSYGILIFIDMDGNSDLNDGDVYQFYNNKQYDPDEVYVNQNETRNVQFNTDYIWAESFTENFDDGVADRWTAFNPVRWSFEFIGPDGEYKMTGIKDESWAMSAYEQDFDDFTYSVQAFKENSGASSSTYGIFFRSSDPWKLSMGTFSGYLFTMNGVGNYDLERGDNGAFTTLFSSAGAPVNTQGYWNNVEVLCTGSTISIYLNSTHLTTINDATYLWGKVGVCGFDAAASTNTYKFDNAELF